MTGGAFPFADGRMLEWPRELVLLIVVTGHTGLAAAPGEQFRIRTAVRLMAGITACVQRGMNVLLGAPFLDGARMARAAECLALGLEQFAEGSSMGTVTGRALSIHRRLVMRDSFQLFANGVVTFKTELFLIADEQTLLAGCVRSVARRARALESGVYVYFFLLFVFLVTVTLEADLGIFLCEHRLLRF